MEIAETELKKAFKKGNDFISLYDTPKKCYRLLGLNDGDNPEKVKKAHRKLCLKYHPDKHPDDPKKANGLLKIINYARGKIDRSFENNKNTMCINVWNTLCEIMARGSIGTLIEMLTKIQNKQKDIYIFLLSGEKLNVFLSIYVELSKNPDKVEEDQKEKLRNFIIPFIEKKIVQEYDNFYSQEGLCLQDIVYHFAVYETPSGIKHICDNLNKEGAELIFKHISSDKFSYANMQDKNSLSNIARLLFYTSCNEQKFKEKVEGIENIDIEKIEKQTLEEKLNSFVKDEKCSDFPHIFFVLVNFLNVTQSKEKKIVLKEYLQRLINKKPETKQGIQEYLYKECMSIFALHKLPDLPNPLQYQAQQQQQPQQHEEESINIDGDKSSKIFRVLYDNRGKMGFPIVLVLTSLAIAAFSLKGRDLNLVNIGIACLVGLFVAGFGGVAGYIYDKKQNADLWPKDDLKHKNKCSLNECQPETSTQIVCDEVLYKKSTDIKI